MEQLRLMPHNEEAEQSILGAMLLDKDASNIAFKKLEPVHFYKEYNREIFESMIELHEEDQPIDLITLAEKLKSRGLMEQIGVSYIASLSSIVPTTSNINYYIKIIKDKYTARQLIEISRGIAMKLYEGEIKDIEKDIENINFTISNNKSIEKMVLNASNIKRNKAKRSFLKTGFKGLDILLSGGLRTSSLTILTGEPGAGKSTLINQIIAENVHEKNNCFLYTGELDNSDAIHWLKRAVVNEYHIKEFTNRHGAKYYDISDYTWDLISQWLDEKLFIPHDEFIANKTNVLTVLEEMVVSKGVKLIILDNLMTLNVGDSDKQYQEQKQICLQLKQMAKKYDIAIILVAHPKKPGDKNKGKEKPKASMYDVLGASEIVNISDNVLRIERADDFTELMVLKNRWGGTVNRSFNLAFDKRRSRFYTDGSELKKDYGYDTNKQFVQVDMEPPF